MGTSLCRGAARPQRPHLFAAAAAALRERERVRPRRANTNTLRASIIMADAEIAQLVGMGFTAEQAAGALDACYGSFDQAVDLLLASDGPGCARPLSPNSNGAGGLLLAQGAGRHVATLHEDAGGAN